MVKIIIFICMFQVIVGAQNYRHKSEAQIAAMTSEQRVDEFAKEYVSHRYDVLDEQGDLFRTYIAIDGLKAVPRLIEIINEYDPTKQSGTRGSKRQRFEAAYQMLSYIDGFSIRLRSSEIGTQAIAALERALARMEAAGFSKLDNDKEKKNTLFFTKYYLNRMKTLSSKDQSIAETLRYHYEIELSDPELEAFVEFLITQYREYPGWSTGTRMHDKKRRGPGGYPLPIIVLEKPELYRAVYEEFVKSKK